jgi:hypothetical protein
MDCQERLLVLDDCNQLNTARVSKKADALKRHLLFSILVAMIAPNLLSVFFLFLLFVLRDILFTS